MKNKHRVQIGTLAIDPVTMDDAVRFVAHRLEQNGGAPSILATINAQFVCIGNTLRRFANFIHHADLVVADGASVVAASHLLGQPLPERVTGVDLVVHMCEEAARSNHTVYFLGGKPGMAEKAVRTLVERFPGLLVAGIDCPPVGFETDPESNSLVFERVVTAGPDILFVALGAPKQEFWIESNSASLPVKAVIGVGGSFEMLAGDVRRAPGWMQRIGFEWAFRFAHEPRRLWKRYVFGNIHFLCIISYQWLMQHTHHSANSIDRPGPIEA